MPDSSFKGRLIRALVRGRVVFALLGIVIGAAVVTVAMLKTGDALQNILNSLGGALLGASLLTLFSAFTLPTEVAELVRQEELRKVLRDAFDQSENVRQDAARLGISRIFGDLDEVRKMVPLPRLLDGASEVYLLGTSLSSTVRLRGLVKNSPQTKFYFIYVSAPEATLLRSLEVIHDVPLPAKLEATAVELDDLKAKNTNVDFRAVKCVPTFSALLALGTSDSGEAWGRLQIDHYLLRTPCDERLWFYLEDLNSPLFKRYRKLVQDMWNHVEKFDIGTAQIASGGA